jgi:hypothetical protein
VQNGFFRTKQSKDELDSGASGNLSEPMEKKGTVNAIYHLFRPQKFHTCRSKLNIP